MYFKLIISFALVISCNVKAQMPNSDASVNFPTRPIRIVVPYVLGGSTDLLSRLIGDASSGNPPINN